MVILSMAGVMRHPSRGTGTPHSSGGLIPGGRTWQRMSASVELVQPSAAEPAEIGAVGRSAGAGHCMMLAARSVLIAGGYETHDPVR
jgi:hypothetical protein